MEITTVTSREFDLDAPSAKRRADRGPVFITDSGQPAYVLLTIAEYNRLAGMGKSVAEALAQSGGSEYDFEVEFPRSRELAPSFDIDLD